MFLFYNLRQRFMPSLVHWWFYHLSGANAFAFRARYSYEALNNFINVNLLMNLWSRHKIHLYLKYTSFDSINCFNMSPAKSCHFFLIFLFWQIFRLRRFVEGFVSSCKNAIICHTRVGIDQMLLVSGRLLVGSSTWGHVKPYWLPFEFMSRYTVGYNVFRKFCV